MSSSHGHFISKCKHGLTVGQCRCLSADKTIHIVECPRNCYEAFIEAGGEPGLQTTPPISKYEEWIRALTDVINVHSMETPSECSGRTLAEYLNSCLEAFNDAVHTRDRVDEP